MKTFEEFLAESLGQFKGEYGPVFTQHHFKPYSGHHKHPVHGLVKVNQHGHWEHTHPSGQKFEGSSGHSLDKHLSRVKAGNPH